MAYTIQALIGDQGDLKSRSIEGATVITLPQGKALLPVCEAVRERFQIPFLEFGHTDAAFEKVSTLVAQLAADKIAYVEAEFFGGQGGQSAAVWKEGKLVFGPVVSEYAINEALKLLGVVKDDAHDEFDAIELGMHRDTEDWIE
jgi:hypothetical protein